MIDRCLECHSPIFSNSCLCGKNVVRCPNCGGDGRKKVIELLGGIDGDYMGYVLKPLSERCEVCGGIGRVGVKYKQLGEI